MIRRQVVIPVDPDRLWDALTDPDQAAGWFGGRIEWELRQGAPLSFRDDDGSGREGRVEAVRPGRYLRYRWWKVEPQGAAESEVTYLIEPTREGCRLTIQERDVATPAIGPDPLARGSWLGRESGSSPTRWTRWDERVAGAWAGLASSRAPA